MDIRILQTALKKLKVTFPTVMGGGISGNVVRVPNGHVLTAANHGQRLASATYNSIVVYVPPGLPAGFSVELLQDRSEGVADVTLEPLAESDVQLYCKTGYLKITNGVLGVLHVAKLTEDDEYLVSGDLTASSDLLDPIERDTDLLLNDSHHDRVLVTAGSAPVTFTVDDSLRLDFTCTIIQGNADAIAYLDEEGGSTGSVLAPAGKLRRTRELYSQMTLRIASEQLRVVGGDLADDPG